MSSEGFLSQEEEQQQEKRNSFSFFSQLSQVIKQYFNSLKSSKAKPQKNNSEDAYSPDVELLKSIDHLKKSYEFRLNYLEKMLEEKEKKLNQQKNLIYSLEKKVPGGEVKERRGLSDILNQYQSLCLINNDKEDNTEVMMDEGEKKTYNKELLKSDYMGRFFLKNNKQIRKIVYSSFETDELCQEKSKIIALTEENKSLLLKNLQYEKEMNEMLLLTNQLKDEIEGMKAAERKGDSENNDIVGLNMEIIRNVILTADQVGAFTEKHKEYEEIISNLEDEVRELMGERDLALVKYTELETQLKESEKQKKKIETLENEIAKLKAKEEQRVQKEALMKEKEAAEKGGKRKILTLKRKNCNEEVTEELPKSDEKKVCELLPHEKGTIEEESEEEIKKKKTNGRRLPGKTSLQNLKEEQKSVLTTVFTEPIKKEEPAVVNQPVTAPKKAPTIGLLSGMNICSSCCLLIRRNDQFFTCFKCEGLTHSKCKGGETGEATTYCKNCWKKVQQQPAPQVTVQATAPAIIPPYTHNKLSTPTKQESVKTFQMETNTTKHSPLKHEILDTDTKTSTSTPKKLPTTASKSPNHDIPIINESNEITQSSPKQSPFKRLVRTRSHSQHEEQEEEQNKKMNSILSKSDDDLLIEEKMKEEKIVQISKEDLIEANNFSFCKPQENENDEVNLPTGRILEEVEKMVCEEDK